ncbi:toll-like receptor 4 [Crassostrea virginica]
MGNILPREFLFFVNIFVLVMTSVDASNCTLVKKLDGIKVDCSDIGLTNFPNFCENNGSAFGLPDDFSSVDIVELDLSHNRIESTNNNHFHCLINLKILNLESNRIQLNSRNYYEGIFSPFISLFRLNLKRNSENGEINDKAFAALQNLEELKIDIPVGTVFGKGFSILKSLRNLDISGPATELCRSHLSALSNTSLKELNLAGNRLNWMETGVLKNLPKSLEKMSLAENRLSLGVYAFEYRLLYNLRDLNYSLQLYPASIVKKLTENCLENPDLYRCSNTTSTHNSLDKFKLRESFTKDLGSKLFITINIPPQLERVYLNSSRLYGALGSYGMYPSSLKKIFLQNNILFQWNGPVHGFENVTELDISKNFCNNISTEFFTYFFGLKKLYMSDNYLGTSLSLDYKGQTFRNLFNLEFVNLSRNEINFLHREIFSNSSKMKYLILSRNKIFRWEVRINHMKNLSFLDLSDNRLSTLSSPAMQDLEYLFTIDDPRLLIHLDNNQLSCSCRNLGFLKWMRNFRSHFKNYDKYTCMEDSSTLDRSIDLLKIECKSYLLWYIIGAILCTLVISITISVLIYKHRWKIRYLRYIANKKFQGYQKLPGSSIAGEYDYDAYVSYHEEDVSFVKHDMVQHLEETFGLKLVIMHRDMVPCGDHAANIMGCICQSKHVICVVTRGYIESSWQMYELNMARMEGIEARRTLRFVHLILMPDVCTSKYPRTVRDFIRKGYYTEYPDDQTGNAVFWEKLKNEIKGDLLSRSLKSL